ncbi:hypothetical protein BAMA_03835 [Bacillus manliponensis]|uniref:Group-specific protein n=1 Tax=Bacillus manliponensis TaxID=574376 RepID=A0A073JWQ2_9BACI|nr:hypothetical protein [Bacillus manliponensis]KEK18647.1 hypothetical protein BAMA_03835 [Bacillus manliponensis]
MPKHTVFGKLFVGFGLVAIFLGLCMANVISDVPLFQGEHKNLGIAIVVLGVISMIVSNFFKIRKLNNAL